MGKPALRPKVKLVCGIIFSQEEALSSTKALLCKRFSALDFESGVIDFNFTDYYRLEMGSGLKRQFISFSRLIDPGGLCGIKAFTNKIEARFAINSRRQVNIDPGCLDMSRLVLATTKDYSHRIYIGQGIFAEVTLSYRNNSFSPLEWTYPDYRSREYAGIFNKIREIYRGQIRG